MNFMLEWQEQYLTSERSERVCYYSCQENIKFISSSQRVMFFLLYRHTNDGVIDNFPKISGHFPKISEDSPKFFKFVQMLPNIFRKCPKIAEDFRRLSRKTRRYSHHTQTNLSRI